MILVTGATGTIGVEPVRLLSRHPGRHRADGPRRRGGPRPRHGARSWSGHRLLADLPITIDGDVTLLDAHHLSEQIRHRLLHDIDHLEDAWIHVNPTGRLALARTNATVPHNVG